MNFIYLQIQESLAPPTADPGGIWKACKSDHSHCNSSQIQFFQGKVFIVTITISNYAESAQCLMLSMLFFLLTPNRIQESNGVCHKSVLYIRPERSFHKLLLRALSVRKTGHLVCSRFSPTKRKGNITLRKPFMLFLSQCSNRKFVKTLLIIFFLSESRRVCR